MSDRFEMSGDFRGAIVNIKSTLSNVQQSIGDIRSQDATTKAELPGDDLAGDTSWREI